MAKHERLHNEEARSEIARNLLGFSVVGLLCYLDETGVYRQLQGGGIEVDEAAGFDYARKARAGNLGFLYASGMLDLRDGRYVLPEKTDITDENIAAAACLRAALREGDASVLTLLQNDPPEIIRYGVAVPIMSALRRQTEEMGGVFEPGLWRGTLENLRLIDSHADLTEVGDALMTHRVIASFGMLTHSYENLILHLADAELHPEKRAFDGEYSRTQWENAWASNALIANTLNRLRTWMGERFNRMLDLGSGGGFSALSLGLLSILFDMSQTANDHALEVFSRAGKSDKVLAAITGHISNNAHLQDAKAHEPDIVFINYIVHDIMGQAASYEEGLGVVERFLRDYVQIFGETPLCVTESWDVSWEDLRRGGKEYISLYTWLHAISPQRLISKEVLVSLLERVGMEVDDSISHGTLIIGGEERVINETLVVSRAKTG